MKLIFHTEDLTKDTLIAIRNDMAKYAHLAMYKQTWIEVNQAIKNREHLLVTPEDYKEKDSAK